MFKKLIAPLFLSLSIVLFVPFSIDSAHALSCASMGGYVVNQDQIIYRQQSRRDSQNINITLHNVDRGSFHPLTGKTALWTSCINPYGVDKNHVFYKGRIIEGVKGRSFTKHDKAQGSYTDGYVIVINGKIVGNIADKRIKLVDGYFKLGQNYFYHDIQLPEPIIKYIGANYAISQHTVYRSGKPTNFDPQTFEIISSYLRDKNGVYCGRGLRKLDADPATFKLHFQNGTFGADKESFFFECHKVNQAKGAFLDLFAHGLMRDENHVYFIKNPVKGLDPESLVVHFQGGKYIQDKNGVYFITRKNFTASTIKFRKIEGADLSTFQATSRSKARDIINLYKKHKRTGENWEGLKHRPNAIFRVHRKRLYKLKIPTPFAHNF